MMLTGKNLIGYKLFGMNNETFSVAINFKNETGAYAFHEAATAEIDQAAMLAANAFEQYRKLSGTEKAFFLETLADAIAAAKDELIPVAMQETKLPQPRLEGEVQRTINQIKLFASLLREGSWVKAVIDTAQPDRKPLPKPDIRQMQIPLGPVAVFGASNFPFAFSVAGGDTISALAAGCPVIYKAHPAHPATSELVAQLVIDALKKCNMPEGLFALLQGKSNACSITLVQHPLVKAVAFTGSFTGGKALFDAACKRQEPIPVYAEMGSVNPVFILPNIMSKDANGIAEKLAASNLLSVGQFCTNPGLIFSVKSTDTENFLSTFASAIKQSNAGCMLSENIYHNYSANIKSLLVTEKLKLKSYGKEANTDKTVTAHMFQTDAKAFLANKDLWHEVFGPASIHVVAENIEELYSIANELQGQLTASVWADEDDMYAANELAQILALKAGRIMLNNVPTGVEVTHAMVHGGPYPATTDARSTSVGTAAIYRFTRPVCYQNFTQQMLPDALKNKNTLSIQRFVDGKIDQRDID
ncbi:aldehyde dehydrogenase (NADP(+)) [Panacibacter ginsenosidivorans]|uniref:Aldehyde dehydrogenase (NADP(+)) n=1 Tax=Panacibacter ginsenosidivorans TaxID=1813871 RepID=A0A5B8V5J6_9BACT|nr:aldehyde dehydrogenase (NADP(+)) [Panacibacter ginsenosidivorans]QEC66660.1 aldehyde dehydrogenase (NADP(+)) [Panacibacter ginsenosidivorans]